MILAVLPWILFELIPYLAVNMAIAYGLSYLGGLLFGGQDIKGAEEEPRGQSFAWRPHTTHQEGIPHPMCYGRNQHYGNVLMRWTDVDALSGNEVLYKVLGYGRGPVQGVAGGLLSDDNKCFGGTPTFAILYQSYIDNWYQTAADVNDADKTTYVGFYGKDAKSHVVKGRFKSEVEFASTSIDRLEYCRYWYLKGSSTHQGYEKVYLWYDGSYHLVSTKNYTTEGLSTDTIVIEAGGPWAGVTKIKIEVELSACGFYIIASHKNYGTVSYRLYELRAWHLEDVPVFLNGQPAHNFTEARVQGRPGTLNQTCMEGFEKNKLQYAPETTIACGEPVRWTSPNKFFDDIEFTLAWLGGLYHYGSDGGIHTHGVGVKVEISERDAESWDTILDTTVSAKQLKALYKAYSVNELWAPSTITHGTQYDLRFSKTTDDKSPGRYGDKVQLRSIREVVDVAFTHPGEALLGITVEATERLQGNIDITWVTDDKLVQVYDSETGTWPIEYSRNRAYVDLAIRTQPVIGGDGGANPWVVERYEGLNPSRIDLALWYKWAQWCDEDVPSGVGEETEKRMPCDIICDRQTNVWSIAYEIAQIGRMTPYWQGHALTGWIDKVTDEPIDLITMDNTMARSWKSSYAGYGEMAGSVEVFYKDALQGYARKPRPVHNENAGLYTRIIALEGVGVTSESLATRVGNHVLNRNALIKNINSVRMGREALRYRLGRVVRIQSRVPNWGQAFRVITSPTSSTVQLDRIIEGVFVGDLFFVKTAHATTKVVSLNVYIVQSVAGKVVTITTTWAAGRTPLRDHMAAIGMDGDIKLRRIIKMGHTAYNYFDVTLETYATTLFESDGVDPVLTNPDYVQPVTEIVEPMSHQAVVDLINALAAPLPTISKPQLSNCGWMGDEVDTVSWSKRNADEPILLRWEGETHEIEPGDTTDEFIYWDSEYPTVFQTTNTPTTLTADYLVCTNKDGVAQQADMLQMTHGAIIQVGTLIAAQIIIGGINALALMNAPAEAGADVTGSHQGDISLANLAERSVDSLVNGTYAKMLASWRHGSDPTKMNLGLGFAASITTAQIGLLAVHTAQINNLAVDTLQVAGEAITTEKIADHAATQEYGELSNPGSLEYISSSGTTICGPVEITTTGGDVKLSVTVYYGSSPGNDDFWCFFRKDGVQMEPAGLVSVTALAAWSDLMCYSREYRVTSLPADTYDFTVKAYCTNDDACIGQRFFTVQELKK